MPKRVTGKFLTKFGLCRFSMSDAKKLTVFLGPERGRGIVVNRVEYTGQFAMQRLDTGNGEWTEIGGNANIDRADKKKVPIGNDTYYSLRPQIIKDWTAYITHPRNAGVLTMAAHVKIEGERQQYINDLANAEDKVRECRNTLESFDRAKFDLRNALEMGVARLTDDNYDIHNVKIED